MAKAAATGRNLSLVLFLILSLSCLGSSQPNDTHSLSCNITVRVRPTPGQPCYEAQCSLDGESFLRYDNDNKATPLGDLGKAIHDTQVWTDLIQRLEYLGQELRKKLADTKQETTDPSGHPTLQAIVHSKYKQGHIIGASWRFNVSGKYFFILNTMNMSLTPISLEARGIMNDEQFIRDLKVISTADSSHWLKELLKHQKEKPRPTSRAPGIYLPPIIDATPHPSTRQFPNNKESIIIAVVISIIIILIVILICMFVKRKCCPQGGCKAMGDVWTSSYKVFLIPPTVVKL
ncbi:retinoic acid early-inducible protein 1-alpha-like [Peromyscus californicus insignis]|uniref:retinoic acid early-inducible protein 1-alpha-like n=1 Tax=Peromyscus californicus insignis TaxID=564181 RepID=UPI0022A693AB|nr:retinoic acid early-inducible protein 1-alpha-like [Peromyscus californicus insignis]